MKPKLILLIILLMINAVSYSQNNTYYGTNAGNGTTGGYGAFFGVSAGNVNKGNWNTFIGYYSGKVNNNGFGNVFIGHESGLDNTDGFQNVFMGKSAGANNTTGVGNSYIGYYAGYSNITGGHNVNFGNYSGYSNTTSYNVFLGSQSGKNNISGKKNVFIGYQAGYDELGSDKLYIENSSSSVPLIYGDFSTNQLGVNTLPGNFTLNVGGPINATGLYVNGQAVSFGAIPPGVSPWTIDGTAINYNNGNVGLGILSNAPAYKLDVNGAINASGFHLNGAPLGQWTASGSTIYYSGGNVGIGTTNTGSFKLAVEGKIAAREVQVTTENPWPDYVFDAEHKLLTLLEVEQFIKENRHLPEIPSEGDIKVKGHNLGEMNVLLLKKIEELTLYVIDLKKEIDKIKKENESLKSNPKK
jgi:hypothetical protein